jgi:bifunctional NMN adenylyltransferase/nudix hydrolase
MSNKKYDTLVLIGRFQPVHSAHVEIIRRAVALTRELIIIVGSANQPRTYKNPWTSKEREMMLQNVLDGLHDAGQLGTTRVHVEHNIDTIYNDTAWMQRVQGIVSKYRILGGTTGIIGHKKDESSFYLDMFPQWELEELPLIQPLNATNVRELYFRRDVNMNFIRGVVPSSTFRLLDGWLVSPDREQVIREREFVEKYKQQYSSLPYPPIFVTADTVVLCAGHVLMIKRRAEPGKGLWALPGGFVNAETDKSVRDAAIRELREETGIKVPVPVLVGSIVRSQTFDAINRSARGRTITHAFLIALGSNTELPKVKGNDDAEKAQWIPLADVKSDQCFEDHFEIISNMVGA